VKGSEAYLSGTSQFLQYPEFRDVAKAHRILDYLSDESELLKLPIPEQESDLKITIGPENLADELRDSSLIVARYNAGDSMQGLIGVVGPTRMDYSKVAARLSYTARGLGWLLSGGNIPPPKSGGDKDQIRPGD
jgi:heat-inducible transcriptional repressor